jgi:N utilization substance protein A
MKKEEQLEILETLRAISREKEIPFEAILDALAHALVIAYKRIPGAAKDARVTIDPETGEIRVYAQEYDNEGRLIREWEDTPENFGRIAAQTAKHQMAQRIRELVREQKFREYAGREGELATGIVRQTDPRFLLLDLGQIEALLPISEQVPGERYEPGMRLRAYIVEVKRASRGPQVKVSRTHPDFVRRLFELEVPEIASGIVEIKAIAREPGQRTKIAVASNDPQKDPVGACVGPRGSRVRAVVNELRGEKVEIVEWSPDPAKLVANALQPAEVRKVEIDEETNTAHVIVPDNQLSQAIGREGQNARLVAKLTGLRIDIKSETQAREAEKSGVTDGQVYDAGPAEALTGGETATGSDSDGQQGSGETAPVDELAAEASEPSGDSGGESGGKEHTVEPELDSRPASESQEGVSLPSRATSA